MRYLVDMGELVTVIARHEREAALIALNTREREQWKSLEFVDVLTPGGVFLYRLFTDPAAIPCPEAYEAMT